MAANESTEAAYEAEVGVRNRLLPTQSSSGGDLQRGKIATVTDEGAVDEDFNENTPLLGASSRSYSNGSDASAKAPRWDARADFEGMPWWMRPGIFWMLGPFALFALAFGTIFVPKTNLIKQLICRDYYTEHMSKDPNFTFAPVTPGGQLAEQCRSDEVVAKTTWFLLGAALVSGILSAITSPKIGALSDRYGRIPIISITACGSLLGEVFTILAATYPDTFNVNWLYLGFVFEGITGSFIAGMALAHAYAVDCTPPSKRNVAFGYFHGALFVGIAIGPILGGIIVKATGDRRSVFFLALACHLVFICFVGFVVPESLSKRRQIAAREKYALEQKKRDANSTRTTATLRRMNILEPLKILWPTGPGSSGPLRRNLVLLAAVDTTMFGVAMGSVSIVVLYMNKTFGWEDFEQAAVISIINVCRCIGLFIVLPVVVRIVRGPSSWMARQRQTGCDGLDLAIIRVATLLDTIGYLGYTLVRTGPLYALSGVVASFGGVGSPTLQSSLTKHVPPDRVGQLLGATGLLHALARVVAPTVCNAIYASTVGKWDQAVFAVLTFGFAIASILAWFVKSHVYLEVTEEQNAATNHATEAETDLIRSE